MSHTNGPWKRVPQTQGGDLIAHPFETGNQMNPQGLRIVALMMARNDSLAEDEANARLIASAPEILEALKGVLAVADRKTKEFDAARAAISKAEGREK